MSASFWTLMTFPKELLTLVLECLDYGTLLNCRTTCSSLKALVDDTSSLRYRLELAAAGKVDGNASSLTTKERLQRLRECESAWSHLKWSKSQKKLVLSGVGLWDISGNCFANTWDDDLFFTPLPSSTRRASGNAEWKINLANAVDMSMHATQGLLVKMENVSTPQPEDSIFHIHLLSMKDGAPHPDATIPMFKSTMPGKPGPWQFDFEVMDDFVGIMFIHCGNEAFNWLSIWNWRTGEEFPGLSGEDLDSFAFIPGPYILASFIPAWREYYAIRDQERPQLGIHVYSFTDGVSQVEPRKVGSLLYPAVNATASVFRGAFFKNPVTSGPALGQENAPFYASKEERVYALQIELKSMSGIDDTLLLVNCIPSSLLRHRIRQMEEHFEATGSPLSLSWSSWGPAGTRLFVKAIHMQHLDTMDGYMHRLYGSRYVSCGAETAAGGKSMLRITVHDFSQKGFWRGKQQAHSECSPEHGWAYHDSDDGTYGPYMEIIKEILDCDVSLATSLPYRSMTQVVEPPEGADPFKCVTMLSEDGIVIVCDDDVRDKLWMQVLTI